MPGPRDWTPPEDSQPWEHAAKSSSGRTARTNRIVFLWLPLAVLAVLVLVAVTR